MHSKSLEKFIVDANQTWQTPQWFDTEAEPSSSPWHWLQQDLNTGIINTFDFPEGKSNCTDPKGIFRTEPFPPMSMADDPFVYDGLLNLWSCAFFPNLSRDARESHLPSENISFLQDRLVDTSPSLAASVSSFLSKCLVAYCEFTPSCKAPSCTAAQLNLDGSMLSALAIDDCLDNICKTNPENLSNPDIAGVGVVYSFYIQFAVACLAALGLIFCMYASQQVPVKDSPNSPPVLVTKILRVQKLMETMLVTLDDFQRAQCCFAIAVDIAALVTLHTRTTELTRRDRFGMLFASTAGITPTTMVLTGMMALKERHSALTFWLTCFTWALSLSVVLHPETLRGMRTTRPLGSGSSGTGSSGNTSFGNRSPSDDILGPPGDILGSVNPQLYPEACGYITPAVLCGPQPSVAGTTYLMLSSLVGIPLLLAWYLWPSAVRLLQHVLPGLRSRLAATPYLTISKIESYTPPLRPRLRRVTKLMVLITYCGCFISVGFFLLNVANDARTNDVQKEWTFGQIVAMIVWLPSLLAFLNDCMYGSLRGRTTQLPDTMTIVRVLLPREESVIALPDEQELQSVLPVASQVVMSG